MQIKLLGITSMDFNTVDQLIRSSILEKKWEYNGTVYQLFIDFKKAYDSVRREYYTIFPLCLEYQEN
jgi:hypothetical protein